jgi:hypothetical protein
MKLFTVRGKSVFGIMTVIFVVIIFSLLVRQDSDFFVALFKALTVSITALFVLGLIEQTVAVYTDDEEKAKLEEIRKEKR